MKYVNNIVMNGIPLGLFLYGIMAGVSWALTAAVILYWLTIAVSAAAVKIKPSVFFEGKLTLVSFRASIKLVEKALDKWYVNFNIIQDIAVAFVFSYFGFTFLAIFYTLHIFGYVILYWNVKEYIISNFPAEAWGRAAPALEKALERGETEFSFYELMGKRDPSLQADQDDKWGGIR